MVADFYPPMTYSPVWMALGVAVLCAAVGWGVVIWAQTRPARQPKAAPLPADWWLHQLKAQYIERIDEIVRLAGAGEMSPRRAHQELSIALRQFVQETSGVTAPNMTLAELGGQRDPALMPVTDLVRGIYPIEFGPERHVSVSSAAAYARDVVARWT